MKRVLSVILALFITLGCAPCLAAKVQTDPFGPQGETKICDTGRGYIAYSFYSSAVYYSADGAAWTDLSDRAWVRDAASYIYLGVGPHGHREFDLLWTGSEYMLRQSLLDDPRGAYTRQGDSPRNRVVTFLDEEFQVIGEMAFDGPVTAMRCQDGTYYATVGGAETAFTRADWTTAFADVPAGAWYAPYADVCVEEGLMKGVGSGLFAPERTLTGQECSVLALRLYDLNHGGDGTFAPAPTGWGQITLTLADGSTLSGAIGDGCAVKGTSLADETWAWGLFEDRDAGRPYSQHLYMDIDTPEELAWLEQIGGRGWPDAVATYDGVKYPGEMRFFSLDEERGGFYFHPDDYEGFLAATQHVRPFAADADAWYRDAWYYAYTHRAEDNTDSDYYLMEGLVGSNSATRRDFASRLAWVAGELPAINAIEAIPVEDALEGDLLPLYNAGVLTGVDDYGTFYPEGTLTRAECAAMLARVLRPELRLTFTPLPFREGYSVPAARYGQAYRLTYVGEIPQEPPQEQEPAQSQSHRGDWLLEQGVYAAFDYVWDDPDYTGPTRYRFCTEDGRSGWVDPDTGEECSFPAGETPDHYTHFKNGYLNCYDRYYGVDLKPVTQRFQFIYDVDATGRGYVHWKGELYEIQFES